MTELKLHIKNSELVHNWSGPSSFYEKYAENADKQPLIWTVGIIFYSARGQWSIGKFIIENLWPR